SPADRLWSAPLDPAPPPPLGGAQARSARAWVSRLASDKPDERERAVSELKAFGLPVLPILEEGTRVADAEVAGRCRTLIEELRPRPRTWGTLPPSNHWKSQTLAGAGRKVADQLQTQKLDLAFENTAVSDILAFVKDFTGLKIAVE